MGWSLGRQTEGPVSGCCVVSALRGSGTGPPSAPTPTAHSTDGKSQPGCQRGRARGEGPLDMSSHGLYLVWACRERETETWSLPQFSQGHQSQPADPSSWSHAAPITPQRPPPHHLTGAGLPHGGPGGPRSAAEGFSRWQGQVCTLTHSSSQKHKQKTTYKQSKNTFAE